MNKQIRQKRLGNIYGEDKGESFAGNVWSQYGICPTVTTCQGGNRMPLIIDDLYENRKPRIYKEYSPSLRSERNGLKVLEDERTNKDA